MAPPYKVIVYWETILYTPSLLLMHATTQDSTEVLPMTCTLQLIKRQAGERGWMEGHVTFIAEQEAGLLIVLHGRYECMCNTSGMHPMSVPRPSGSEPLHMWCITVRVTCMCLRDGDRWGEEWNDFAKRRTMANRGSNDSRIFWWD